MRAGEAGGVQEHAGEPEAAVATVVPAGKSTDAPTTGAVTETAEPEPVSPHSTVGLTVGLGFAQLAVAVGPLPVPVVVQPLADVAVDAAHHPVGVGLIAHDVPGGLLHELPVELQPRRGRGVELADLAGNLGEPAHVLGVVRSEDPELPAKIWAIDKQVKIGSKGEKSNWGGFLLSTMLPILFLVGIMILFMRQMEAGGNRAFSFGRSRAKLITGDRPKVTFQDVAGADEAKEELQEVIEFLREKYRMNDPIPVQYFAWIGNALQGDLGISAGVILLLDINHRHDAPLGTRPYGRV